MHDCPFCGCGPGETLLSDHGPEQEPKRTADDAVSEARTLLRAIEHWPGARWPSRFNIKGTLIADCRRWEELHLGTEGPWAGVTLPAANLIADAPRLLRELCDIIERKEAEE